MADDTKSDDQKGSPDDGDNPNDNKDSKTEAHWQKIADERFLENEKLKKELEEAKKKDDNKTEVEELRGRLAAIETDKEKTRLETEFPDIEPELLLGKTPEKQKEIAERQRARTKELTKNSIDVNPPQYSQTDLDDQIDDVKKSNRNPVQKAQEVLRLQRLRRESS